MCVSSCARPAPSGATRPRMRFFAPFRSPSGTSLQGAKSANPPAPPSLGRSPPPFHFGRPRPRSHAPPEGGFPCTFAIFGSRYTMAVGQPCRSLLAGSRYTMAVGQPCRSSLTSGKPPPAPLVRQGVGATFLPIGRPPPRALPSSLPSAPKGGALRLFAHFMVERLFVYFFFVLTSSDLKYTNAVRCAFPPIKNNKNNVPKVS